MGFVTKIFFLSLRAPFWVGKIGAAGVCLFPFDQVEPAEAVLRTHGRVLNSSSGAAVALRQPPKHFRFSCFEKIQLFFFPRRLCSVSLGGRFVPICFRFPQGTRGSASFLLPSPASCHRHLLASSSASESLLCGHFRPRMSASFSRFISTEALVSHISLVLLPPPHHPDGV